MAPPNTLPPTAYTNHDFIHSLCNTECLSALANKCLSIIFPLRTDSYQFKSVGTGTELPVGRFNLTISAVSQVYPAQRMLKLKLIIS